MLLREHFPMTRRKLTASMLATLVVSACAPGSDLPFLPDAPLQRYRLGVGDVIRVTTIGGEPLTGKFAVGDNGDVALPFLGAVHAAGLTTDELSHNISDQLLKRGLFRSPSVVVEVDTYRPIHVLGEVNKPGDYSYAPGMTVLGAVSIAGGFTYRAFMKYASVSRLENAHNIEGRADRNSFVQPGDVVTVFERHF